jgi:hypothetical protein
MRRWGGGSAHVRTSDWICALVHQQVIGCVQSLVDKLGLLTSDSIWFIIYGCDVLSSDANMRA